MPLLLNYQSTLTTIQQMLKMLKTKAIEYLDACRQLFERGILSHEKVTTDQSIVLQNMSDGYAFFVGWADYAWEKGKIWWLFTFHYHYLPIFIYYLGLY